MCNWVAGWLSKIGQMFDQILIDYCNPKTFLVGGKLEKREVNPHIEHRCLIFPIYLQRSFLVIWVTYSSFYQLFGQMLVVKSAIYQYSTNPQLELKKGAIWLKMGSIEVCSSVSMSRYLVLTSELHTAVYVCKSWTKCYFNWKFNKP